MESEVYSKIFQPVLTKDEWLQIPGEIANKIEVFIEEKIEEYITAKARYESGKLDYGILTQ